MSKKPYIKIVYPDASEIAMLLTEAMVRRASGKRVVETESAERESAGQDLFAGTLCCVTETSVELTLNLAPEAMDFALATLIAKNLTQTERDKAMAASESLELDALFSPRAQAAEAPGQALDGSGSADVPSAGREAETQSGEQEKTIEVGKISDNTLRDILSDMAERLEHEDAIEVIEETIKEIDCRAGVIDLDETYNEERDYSYKTYAIFGLILATIELLKPTKRDSPANTLLHYLTIAKEHLEKNSKDAEADFLHALHIGWTSAYNQPQILENARGLVDRITGRLYNEDHPKPDTADPSWDDVEKEARKIGQHKTDKTDKTDENAAEQDGEIEPGLLNDLDDGSDGMASAEEVMGHDE